MQKYSEKIINEVWDSIPSVDGYNPNKWKKDFAGAWINKEFYQNPSKYGWVICLIKPLLYGGDYNLDNLKALHWKNADAKNNDYPCFKTILTSEGNENIEKTQKWKIK